MQFNFEKAKEWGKKNAKTLFIAGKITQATLLPLSANATEEVPPLLTKDTIIENIKAVQPLEKEATPLDLSKNS